MVIKKSVAAGLLCVAVSMGCAPAQAESLKDGLNRILVDHHLIKRVKKEGTALEQQVGVEQANWLPTLAVTGGTGHQRINKTSGSDTNLARHEYSIGLTQTVWDFGQKNGSIRKAKAASDKKNLEIQLQRQNLLLAGIEAHLLLKKAYVEVSHAQTSLNNIKEQARLEDARVRAGSGFNTDVLQAKGQLSLAQARLIDKEGAYAKALNRYKAVFGHDDVQSQELEAVALPQGLPVDEDELLEWVEEKNPDLLQSHALVKVADIETDIEKAKTWGPTIELVADHSYDNDVDGTIGSKTDNSIMLQARWDFNLGFGGVKSINVKQTEASAQREKSYYDAIGVKERAENSWNAMETAKRKVGYLKEQVDLYEEFVRLARKEREMGRRSLLDVLAGETSLLSAKSDYEAAQVDLIVSTFRILRTYGALDVNAL